MAMLRQKGCPTIFLTMSCVEYKWKELVRQILEKEWNQPVSMEYVDKLSNGERNKIITENAVQSTVHFQKRIEKIFNLLKYDDVFDGFHVADFHYRIEFQVSSYRTNEAKTKGGTLGGKNYFFQKSYQNFSREAQMIRFAMLIPKTYRSMIFDRCTPHARPVHALCSVHGACMGRAQVENQ